MDSHPLIYLRADGNETIATGHLMRCLTIARALKRQNATPAFIVSDQISAHLLLRMLTPTEQQERPFLIFQLQTNYREADEELSVLLPFLKAKPPACMLVDSYFVTPGYLSALQKICPIAYLDDLQAFDYPVQMVVNYDLETDRHFYKSARQLLLGCAYTPLREQFSCKNYHLWDQVRDVFISTGGTDPFGVAKGLLNQLLPDPFWKNVCFHVLVGPLHIHHSDLQQLSKADSRVQLHENVQDMADLMAGCDLAFSAGGTTLYELCAVGVPTISYSMADNQIPGVQAFAAAGLIPYLGDVRSRDSFFTDAATALQTLALDRDTRRVQSLQMRMAMDGAGADRIAEALLLTSA